MTLAVHGTLIQAPAIDAGSARTRELRRIKEVFIEIHRRNDFRMINIGNVYLHDAGAAENKYRFRIGIVSAAMRAFQGIDQLYGMEFREFSGRRIRRIIDTSEESAAPV